MSGRGARVKSSGAFVCARPKPGAEKRLFFFPYAGGGPAAFAEWLAALPDRIEGWTAHLPGRGSRHREALLGSVPALLDELAPAIQSLLDLPFAFFGHSLGALLAFELARYLRRLALPLPEVLFVSGCEAPHLPRSQPALHGLPDAEFLEVLGGFNGIPGTLLDQPEIVDVLLPLLRADFRAFETYIYRDEPPLDCRIVAFGGEADPRVRRENVEAWETQTNSSFTSQYFPGDHFFISTNREAIIAQMERAL